MEAHVSVLASGETAMSCRIAMGPDEAAVGLQGTGHGRRVDGLKCERCCQAGSTGLALGADKNVRQPRWSENRCLEFRVRENPDRAGMLATHPHSPVAP